MEQDKKEFLDQLHNSYVKALYRSAYNKLYFNEEKANEVVQTTFLIACLKIDDLYKSKNHFKWLMSVQKYIIKQEKFRFCTGKTEEGEYKFSKEIDIDTVSEEQLPIEEMEFFENSLFDDLKEILSEREIKFIEERYIKDKPYKDIASTLQITETACTSFGNRTHKKIKKFLKKRDKTGENLDI